MRITGITFVGTRTDARPAMARFVREVLGLAAVPPVDGMDADLFSMPDGSSFAVTPGVAPTEDDRTVGFMVDDLDDARRVLLAAGVEIDEAISTNAQFRYLHFRAPDGHLYELVEERAMSDAPYELPPIGWVESPLGDVAAAPNQGDEGAPDASIVLRPDLRPAMRGLAVGDEIVVVTWLDRADRTTLEVHPRGDRGRPLAGVFSTRSPDRPNPIGLHLVHILAIDGTTLRVSDLEAVDGTPVLDLKPVLAPVAER